MRSGGWSMWQYNVVGKVEGAANEAGCVDLDARAEGTSANELLSQTAPACSSKLDWLHPAQAERLLAHNLAVDSD